jgi:hypothetical protein
LQSQLNEAEESLSDIEFEQAIQDQTDALTKLQEEYEELVNKKCKEFYNLLDEGLSKANANTATIASYLNGVAEKNGYAQEYKDTINGNETLQTSTEKVVTAITEQKKSESGANDDSSADSDVSGITAQTNVEQNTGSAGSNAGTLNTNTSNDSKTTTYTGEQLYKMKKNLEAVYANPKYYIKAKKSKASDYKTRVNQATFSSEKKVLTTAGLKAAREALNVSSNYDIYDAIMNLKKLLGGADIKWVGAFSSGGIAKMVKSNGEDGIAMVRNGEGLIAPENVSQIQELLKAVPIMTNLTDSLIKTPDLSNLPVQNISSGDITIDLGGIVMNGVNNPEEFQQQLISAFQNSSKVQKVARAATTDLLAGGSRLGVNRIR